MRAAASTDSLLVSKVVRRSLCNTRLKLAICKKSVSPAIPIHLCSRHISAAGRALAASDGGCRFTTADIDLLLSDKTALIDGPSSSSGVANKLHYCVHE